MIRSVSSDSTQLYQLLLEKKRSNSGKSSSNYNTTSESQTDNVTQNAYESNFQYTTSDNNNIYEATM